MARAAGRTTPSGEGPPTSFPEGPPSSMPWDHSFTLQAVMQMQKDLGVLGEKIERMREDLGELKGDGKETRDQLVEVQRSMSSAQGAMKILGGVFALALVIIAAVLAWMFKA